MGSIFRAGLAVTVCFGAWGSAGWAHIVPPEDLHPVAASYRRMTFMVNLNPIPWEEVAADVRVIMAEMEQVDPNEAIDYLEAADALIHGLTGGRDGAPEPARRRAAARKIMELCTTAIAETLIGLLERAEGDLEDYDAASEALAEARQLWAGFEHEVKATDREGFVRLGRAWLELSGALGRRAVLGQGGMVPNGDLFKAEADKITAYVEANFGDDYRAPAHGRLAPLPARSATFSPHAQVPPRLPPGGNVNKQLPRPRQILNMAERGVDEGETNLIAIGDMAFDSPFIFGEPARSLGISCNTCHNKSITNPQFFIPGLSSHAGGIDVSNAFFAPHANNGHFDPIDIPDLRGIRFTAPYGRNGRFGSLREFVRNVVMHEFGGPEPDPLLLDGMIAYMIEFDFLENPALEQDGKLNDLADESARRGEKLFRKKFAGMGGRSCADCHVPSANFLDHKRHDIGSVKGTGASRDRHLDTPTLLGIKHTPPYFHDGSQPTLRTVNEWFNAQFDLGLDECQLSDLTTYLETVGDGEEAYEETLHTLEAEMEEFSFFLSGYEYLSRINKPRLASITFQTVAAEIQAHKWDLQDHEYMPILNRLARLMDEAYAASEQGDRETVDVKVAEYRELYAQHADKLI